MTLAFPPTPLLRIVEQSTCDRSGFVNVLNLLNWSYPRKPVLHGPLQGCVPPAVTQITRREGTFARCTRPAPKTMLRPSIPMLHPQTPKTTVHNHEKPCATWTRVLRTRPSVPGPCVSDAQGAGSQENWHVARGSGDATKPWMFGHASSHTPSPRHPHTHICITSGEGADDDTVAFLAFQGVVHCSAGQQTAGQQKLQMPLWTLLLPGHKPCTSYNSIRRYHTAHKAQARTNGRTHCPNPWRDKATPAGAETCC